jgi:hypothetical protein
LAGSITSLPGIAKPREDVVVAPVGLARACPNLATD